MADFEKIGRYEVLERIGVGSFTVAYRGRDTLNQRDVAIKICIAQEEHLRTGFLRLAETASVLRHPNIVSVLEFGSGESKPYLVEDFVPGEHLGWKIEAQEHIPWVTRLDYLVQIAQGLRYAHSQGVLHRHVSPRCIRVADGAQAKISDFGIRQLAAATARLADPRGHAETEGYLAPEQALGLRADARTDIFYFGALSYELLTYESPFAGNNLTDFLRRVLDTTDDATIARLRRLPEGIATILRRCLQRDPSARYEDFSRVLNDLRPLLEKERARERPAAADPPSPDDTQEIPRPLGAAAGDPVDKHLQLAAEYMLGPADRPAAADVKPLTAPAGPASLEETLPGIPAPRPVAPEAVKPPPAPAAAVPEVKRKAEAAPPPAPKTAVAPPVAPPKEPERSTPVPHKNKPAAAKRRSRKWWLAAAFSGVALLTVLLATSGLSGSKAPAPVPEPAVAGPAPAPVAPPPAPKGSLVVDAVPWGEVTRITGPNGRVPLAAGTFTPLYLPLAPGDYRIEVRHPEAEEPWICDLQISSGAESTCSGEFELVDVLEYFKKTGWWQ